MNHAQSLKADKIHAVLTAISNGNLAAARALLAPEPPPIEAIAPGFKEAEASIKAAHALYVEALAARAEVLRRAREQVGPGPYLADGRPVQIVSRVRGEREQVFLKEVGSGSQPLGQ